MDLLVFNCGSSSQGFTVYHQNPGGEPDITAFGKARGVATKTLAGAVLEWTIRGEKGSLTADLSYHRLAAEMILKVLRDHHVPVDAVGHRFVNGGEFFDRAAPLDEAALDRLRECLPLAPIHNPNSWSVIEVCREQLPDLPQYAVFDTAFHARIPAENRTYALPFADAEAYGWRKIGFHGLSYQYVSKRAAALLGRQPEDVKLIMCHLGTGGSSVCAFRDGRSFDTSMGWSTNTGLVMSTRSGDVDSGIVVDMMRKGMDPDAITEYLNKKSGLLGLSGCSSNLGEIIAAAEQGDARCQQAFRSYVSRLRSFIGSFLYALNGADALIFTDDAGVKYAKMRAAACADTDFFGLRLDPVRNDAYPGYGEACLSAPESRVQIWVIPTDEERTIYDEIVSLR